jgi:hypothetical protein
MTHLSTLELVRFRAGELSPDRHAAAQQHLADCSTCHARADAAQADDDAVAVEPLPDWLPREGAAQSPGQWALWVRRWLPASTSLAAAALMLVVALPVLRAPAMSGDGLRSKGELPAMEVWVDSDGGARPLEVGEALQEGDRVQLFYDPRGADRVALAGRDHTGAIEIYGVLAPVRDGLQPAPFALTLDDAPGNQELFVVVGDAGLDAAAAEAAVRRGDPAVRRMVLPKERAQR